MVPLADLDPTTSAWETTRQFRVIVLPDVQYGAYQGPNPELQQRVDLEVRYWIDDEDQDVTVNDIVSDDVSIFMDALNTGATWTSLTHLIIRPVSTEWPVDTKSADVKILRIGLRADYSRA